MTVESDLMSRRALLAGIAASGAVLIVGCSGPDERNRTAQQGATEDSIAQASSARGMIVHRDPSCGCCEKWAEMARQAGYQVDLQDNREMPAVKNRLGVPEELTSCHTAEVGGFVIEGHVPLKDVKRLLAERPAGIKGLAVPGMPAGSPGMEMPDGTREPFKVMAFDASGKTTLFVQR